MTGRKNTSGNKPVRTCVICRQQFAKDELQRFVLGKGTSEGELIPDKEKIMLGRGYYVCENQKCLERFKFFRPRKKNFRG